MPPERMTTVWPSATKARPVVCSKMLTALSGVRKFSLTAKPMTKSSAITPTSMTTAGPSHLVNRR